MFIIGVYNIMQTAEIPRGAGHCLNRNCMKEFKSGVHEVKI
jgi:hypothetical protein